MGEMPGHPTEGPTPSSPPGDTHRVNAKRIGPLEDAGDVGVQGEGRVGGEVVRAAGRARGSAQAGTWGGSQGLTGSHLQEERLAMVATLQAEGKMTVGLLKHSL